MNGKLADLAMTSRFEKRPSAVMTSSVIPSLKKSWPASPDRFLNGNTASEGRPARRAGAARLATSSGLDAAPSPSSSQPTPVMKRPHNKAGHDERSGARGCR